MDLHQCGKTLLKKIKSIKQCNEYSNDYFFFENNTFYFQAMLLFLTFSKRIFIN
jgi:hypothetical protein